MQPFQYIYNIRYSKFDVDRQFLLGYHTAHWEMIQVLVLAACLISP